MVEDKAKIIQIASKVTEAIDGTEPLLRSTVLLSYLIEASKEAGLNKEQLVYLVNEFFDDPRNMKKIIFN